MLKKILSLLYFSLYKCNVFLYKKNILKKYYSKNLFVVGVGNLTLGGSGKTPFVKLLSQILSKQKTPHCIISKGYKKQIPGERVLNKLNIGGFTANQVGDEPFMLASELKDPFIFVGNKAKSLLSADKSQRFLYALIDDGYQSFNIKKDYNVLLIDFSLNLNKYTLLPAGYLREPLSKINRAQLVVFTKTNLCSEKEFQNKKKFFEQYINEKKQKIIIAEIKPVFFIVKQKKLIKTADLSCLKKHSFLAFSGIANPTSFHSMQSQLNLTPLKKIVFKDHHFYSKKSIKLIVDSALKNNIKTLLTTKKDYYKIASSSLNKYKIYVVDIEHTLNNPNVLNNIFIRGES